MERYTGPKGSFPHNQSTRSGGPGPVLSGIAIMNPDGGMISANIHAQRVDLCLRNMFDQNVYIMDGT